MVRIVTTLPQTNEWSKKGWTGFWFGESRLDLALANYMTNRTAHVLCLAQNLMFDESSLVIVQKEDKSALRCLRAFGFDLFCSMIKLWWRRFVSCSSVRLRLKSSQ